MATIKSDRPEAVSRSANGKVCPSLSVSLSDEDPSLAWVLVVKVRRNEGSLVTLGSVTTFPAGDRGARAVALAFCPGAVEWSVEAHPVNPPARPVRADLCLVVDHCCSGGAGVYGVAGASVASVGGLTFGNLADVGTHQLDSTSNTLFPLDLGALGSARRVDFLLRYTPAPPYGLTSNVSWMVADQDNYFVAFQGPTAKSFLDTLYYDPTFPFLYTGFRFTVEVPALATSLTVWAYEGGPTNPGQLNVKALVRS